MLGLALTGAMFMCKVKFSGEVPDGSGIRSVAKPGGQWRAMAGSTRGPVEPEAFR
jgi:hypothetical protein